jgi:tetratricopeptide (TPR) repeat protein
MPSPTHTLPQRRPSEIFTNRVRDKKQFEADLEKPQLATEHRLLAWYGVGGQGKTALLGEFERILKTRISGAGERSGHHLGFALIDFENANNRAISTALLTIRGQLYRTAGLHFPTFEFACLRYLAMTQPEVNLKALQERFFTTGSEYLDTLLQALNALGVFGGVVHVMPGFSLITKYGTKLLSKAGYAFTKWWNRRGVRVFADIDELSQDALLRRLPSYFGADLADALAGESPPRIVIMLDTYEALWRGHGLVDGPGALRVDDWVRLLVQDAPGVMFVIVGRDKLRWHQIDKDAGWDGVTEEHLLDGLTRPDSEALLLKWEVAEQDIRARMIKGACSHDFSGTDTSDNKTGVYLPFYLELQAQTYEYIKANGGTPKPEDFGGDQPKILARFMEHLNSEADRLLRVASYLSGLEPATLDMLADKFLGGRASADWSRLYGRSLVSDEKGGMRFLHSLMRKALQEREQYDRPDLYRDIHQVLFDWFEVRCGQPELETITQEQERALLLAIRHLSKFDERKAVRWANAQMQRLDGAARWRALEEVCQLVLPLAESGFGAESEWTTAILGWLASAASSHGHYGEAEKQYERVLAIDEKSLGPEHPSTATTLGSLARVYLDTGRYDEAEKQFERVLAICEKTLGSEHPLTAATLNNLARVYLDTGRYAEAEKQFERVLAICEKTLGPQHPSTAMTLGNLASVYLESGRYAEAEKQLKRVLAIREKNLGPEHPSTATTLHELARGYLDTGRYAEAEKQFERVLAIYQKTLGPEHPWTVTALHGVARVCLDTGRYAEAETQFERAQAICERTLGPEHPSTATMLHELARVCLETGRYAEAEKQFERVLAIREKSLGPEHPATATTLGSLASVYCDTGRYAESTDLFGIAWRVLAAKLPPDHPALARLLVQRGKLHALCGEEGEAADDFSEAVAAFEATGVRQEYRWAREARKGLKLLQRA